MNDGRVDWLRRRVTTLLEIPSRLFDDLWEDKVRVDPQLIGTPFGPKLKLEVFFFVEKISKQKVKIVLCKHI